MDSGARKRTRVRCMINHPPWYDEVLLLRKVNMNHDSVIPYSPSTIAQFKTARVQPRFRWNEESNLGVIEIETSSTLKGTEVHGMTFSMYFDDKELFLIAVGTFISTRTEFRGVEVNA